MINVLKPEAVRKILELKDKVVVGEEIKSLFTHMYVFKELGYSKPTLIQKWKVKNSDLAIQETVCSNLEKNFKCLKIQITIVVITLNFLAFPTIYNDKLEETISNWSFQRY